MKSMYKTLLFISACILCSCNSFLDIEPRGYSIPSTTEDYERLLNNPIFTTQAGLDDILYLGDDLFLPLYNSDGPTTLSNVYCWAEVIDMEITAEPVFWGVLYNRIYTANLVITEVLDSKEGSEEQKKQLWAEALFQRGYQYFLLMNLYAPPYNAATASSDLGVPLKTGTDVTEATPPRATVQECINFIVSDLTGAVRNLPDFGRDKYHPGKYAAYALLSRLYLSMCDYPKAEAYADSALQANHQLLDYNVCFASLTFPEQHESPQELWLIMAVNAYAGLSNYPSDKALAVFNENSREYDTRFTEMIMFEDEVQRWYRYPANIDRPLNFGIGFPELYLTKAETHLRNTGEINESLQWVNKIREKRVDPAGEVQLSAATTEEALQIILDERMRELMMNGLRWMDMRRLDRDGRMATEQRVSMDGDVIATLKPGDKAYTLQIPIRVQYFNPTMPKNAR